MFAFLYPYYFSLMLDTKKQMLSQLRNIHNSKQLTDFTLEREKNSNRLNNQHYTKKDPFTVNLFRKHTEEFLILIGLCWSNFFSWQQLNAFIINLCLVLFSVKVNQNKEEKIIKKKKGRKE